MYDLYISSEWQMAYTWRTEKANISFISWRNDRTVVGFTTTYAISAYHH